MSKTLFWYVFKDLLRIFLMTSLVLAGIMSFGGLLRPLMQYGLSGSQMGEMLMYLLPAMQTYSLPIAALFATTVVYGRLAADNELTACRAGGISYTGMIMPAIVLALMLSIISLLCLSFVVPHFTLKVERVAFNSVAEVVKKRFERKHQIKLKDHVIYADSVDILPSPPERPDDEVVALNGPVICTYDQDKQALPVPTEFYTARRAIAIIRRDEDDVQFTAQLEGGATFPREFQGATLGGIGSAQFGPVPVESLIRENTKFMNIRQLKTLYEYPMRSREIRDLYTKVTKQEQQHEFLSKMIDTLNRTSQCRFLAGNESFTLVLDPEIKIPLPPPAKLTINSAPGSQTRQLRLLHHREGQLITTDEAKQLTLRVQADPRTDLLNLDFQLADALIGTQQGQPARLSFTRKFSIPMPPELLTIKSRGPTHYLHAGIGSDDLRELRRALPGLQCNIVAEIHGRVSFAVSCLILVVVGCALGMMFKTGNYLGAFALSVIPALLCLALMVTGQHIVDNDSTLLKLGLITLWSGNILVLGLAAGLLGHLRRQ